MTRLAAYLVRVFSLDALALFGVALFLLFLAQCLRTFDVVSVKGQDLLTLVGQTALSMPTLAVAFSHVCLGIGLARGLRALQSSQELHIIHSSRRLSALFGAVATYSIGGMILVLLLVHIVEPVARRYNNAWAASIAADLVSRTLTPHRFIEITDGVTIVIGSRAAGGELGSFFADDQRSKSMRRTYSAASAIIAADAEGYVLQMQNGSIQYMSDEQKFSEISFTRYDLAVERLTGDPDTGTGLEGLTTPELIATAIARGGLSSEAASHVGNRFGEGFRVLAICLLAAALAAFPSGKRGGRSVPIEIVILCFALLDRAVTSVQGMPHALLPPSGAVLLALIGLVILGVRLRKLGRGRRREAVA